MTRLLAFAIVLLMSGARAEAQGRNGSPYLETVQEVLLNDGSRVYGTVESETDTEIVFRTAAGGLLTAPRARIASIRPVVGRIVDGEFRREDPNNTRLLFGPTARSLPKGAVYLGFYEFLLPSVQLGITDRVSIGGGTPFVFGIDESTRPFWVTPKVQLLSRGGNHVAAGVFHGFNLDDGGGGVAYGVFTREMRGGSLTTGAGLAYSGGTGRGGVIMIGGDRPLRRNMKLITENYIWRSTRVASLGVRFFGDNVSADLALAVFRSDEIVAGAPILNFAYRF
jgi:hypothetical protein